MDLPLDEAAELVRDCIAEIREENDASPAEREGLARWVEDWRRDHGASPRVTKVMVDATARHLAHLRASGSSPRTVSAVCSNLNAAGHHVLMYNAPKGNRILEHFDGPPWEFKRASLPTARHSWRADRRSLEGFARFLRESGELPNDDG